MSDPEELRADIERQREQLAGTVDALHRELETQAKAAVKPALIAAGATALLLVGYVVWRRRR